MQIQDKIISNEYTAEWVPASVREKSDKLLIFIIFHSFKFEWEVSGFFKEMKVDKEMNLKQVSSVLFNTANSVSKIENRIDNIGKGDIEWKTSTTLISQPVFAVGTIGDVMDSSGFSKQFKSLLNAAKLGGNINNPGWSHNMLQSLFNIEISKEFYDDDEKNNNGWEKIQANIGGQRGKFGIPGIVFYDIFDIISRSTPIKQPTSLKTKYIFAIFDEQSIHIYVNLKKFVNIKPKQKYEVAITDVKFDGTTHLFQIQVNCYTPSGSYCTSNLVFMTGEFHKGKFRFVIEYIYAAGQGKVTKIQIATNQQKQSHTDVKSFLPHYLKNIVNCGSLTINQQNLKDGMYVGGINMNKMLLVRK